MPRILELKTENNELWAKLSPMDWGKEEYGAVTLLNEMEIKQIEMRVWQDIARVIEQKIDALRKEVY